MAAEGAAARSGAGEPSEEARASEQETAAEDPGKKSDCVWCVLNDIQGDKTHN